LPRNTALRRLRRRCLDKNRQLRLAAIADARFDLDEAAVPAPVDDDAHNTVTRLPRRALFVMLAAGIVLALTGSRGAR
jgi:hypothetical protein